MHISINKSESTKVVMLIKADESEINKSKSSSLKKLSSQVKVPGFRTGHVPLVVVEKNIDPNVLQTEVLEQAVNSLYISAVRQEDLRPVSNPEISIKKFVPYSELEFEASVPVIGEIKIADYKKIKHTKKNVKVSKKEVDEVINSLKMRIAERKEVSRPIKDGDEATIDFKGADDKGAAISGADAKDYPLIIGSKSFIPGFEEELIGLAVGEEKTFKIKFPKDYAAKGLQDKEVAFQIKVNKVSEIILPKADDKFATTVGPFDSLESLTKDIEAQLTLEKTQENDTIFENELMDLIAAKSTIEIPKLLVDEQIDRIETEEKQSIIYRGQTWEEHLEEEGVTADEHREQKRSAAEQRVKVGILLSEIADMEDITATPDEIEDRLQLIKSQYKDQAMQSQLNSPDVLRDIEVRIRTEKTMSKLVAYASTPASTDK